MVINEKNRIRNLEYKKKFSGNYSLRMYPKVEIHNELLQTKAQEKFAALQTNQELHEASALMMAIALYLAIGIGANSKNLVEHWIETAKNHGAKE